jgi:hypothetical protein
LLPNSSTSSSSGSPSTGTILTSRPRRERGRARGRARAKTPCAPTAPSNERHSRVTYIRRLTVGTHVSHRSPATANPNSGLDPSRGGEKARNGRVLRKDVLERTRVKNLRSSLYWLCLRCARSCLSFSASMSAWTPALTSSLKTRSLFSFAGRNEDFTRTALQLTGRLWSPVCRKILISHPRICCVGILFSPLAPAPSFPCPTWRVFASLLSLTSRADAN